MNYLIGIDIGTSGTKTVLFDESGAAVLSATYEYPLYQPENGWAEQKPEDWWLAALNSLRDVIKDSHIEPSDIKGIGLSGQMHGLVMLDKDSEVIRPAIIWCDQRTGKECLEITEKIGAKRLIEITANPALTGFTASKILWVKNNEPENYAKCVKILLPKDYIRYKLTGEFATDVSDASGMQLLDVANRCWSDEVLEKLEIDKAMLGKVYESVQITGGVTEEVARKTGLCAGTPVVGGAGDNAAAAVGTGVVRNGGAFTTIGTSGVVYVHSDKVNIDPLGRVHTFCAAVPNSWHMMGVTQAAGLSLQWFRNNFCKEEKDESLASGVDTYDIMNRGAAKIPIGSERLLYLPYLMGERTPHLNPNCRGVFFGLSAIHTKAHLTRAIMEGVSFSLLDCMNILKGMVGDISDMKVCGGGAASPLWRQMLADAYGCNISTVQNKEGPALGAAILAGVGVGVYPSVESACDEIIKSKDTSECVQNNVIRYREFYELYKSLYTNLEVSFNKLQVL